MLRSSNNFVRNFLYYCQTETLKASAARALYSTNKRSPNSTAKITLVSASVGLLVGAGYSGYSHYQVNKKNVIPTDTIQYAVLDRPPAYKPTYKVQNESDNSNLDLVLFQYRTCPFCCKVRAFLDYHGISYDIIEVDAVLRQSIKWSDYKKVPILLTKVDGKYQQLVDSSAIISILSTYLRQGADNLNELINFYPISQYTNENGKVTTDIINKYFIMNQTADGIDRIAENTEREWRKWADSVLVHMLSPNVYRTMNESLQAFNWFAKVGGWWEHFPAWECALMINVGAVAMWIIGKRLKTRHNLKDDVRLSLYDAANEWTAALKAKGSDFMGGKEPGLADLSVYGVLNSIEGCDAFGDLRKNTEIGVWFDKMKTLVESKRGKCIGVPA